MTCEIDVFLTKFLCSNPSILCCYYFCTDKQRENMDQSASPTTFKVTVTCFHILATAIFWSCLQPEIWRNHGFPFCSLHFKVQCKLSIFTCSDKFNSKTLYNVDVNTYAVIQQHWLLNNISKLYMNHITMIIHIRIFYGGLKPMPLVTFQIKRSEFFHQSESCNGIYYPET